VKAASIFPIGERWTEGPGQQVAEAFTGHLYRASRRLPWLELGEYGGEEAISRGCRVDGT
jgi:hypothetical protein